MSDSKKTPISIEAPSYLATVAIQLHEMFGELQRAGFSKSEALEIIGYIAASGVMEPPMYEEGPTMMPIHIQFQAEDEFEDEDYDDEPEGDVKDAPQE
jgi:hypothetical protein